MGKSGENLPKVIQPFSSCSHQLPAHRGCFWRVKPVTEVPPLLVQGPAADVCPWASIRAVRPRAPPRPVSGSQLWHGVATSSVISCRSGLHWALGGVVYNPARGLAGSRGKGLCFPSRTTGIAALCRSLSCSQSGEEADERWISPPSHTRLSQAWPCCRDAKRYARHKGTRGASQGRGLCGLRHSEHRECCC